jgi:putative transposase
VKTPMRRMGLETLYRHPRTSNPNPSPAEVHPYRLRDIKIMRSNQVWAVDITIIPMAHSFVYFAVCWTKQSAGLSWRLSIAMEAAFCAKPLEDALAPHGRPQIFNTDQGEPFTGIGVQRPARHR